MGGLIAPTAEEPWVSSGAREKCAVVAVMDPNGADLAALALAAMDHRGSDSSGIGGITTGGTFELFRRPGAAHEIYTPETRAYLRSLDLVAVVGQDRYATSGAADKHLQPIEAGTGDQKIYLGHNGNLSNVAPLERYLRSRGKDYSQANDSELAAYAYADMIARDLTMTQAAKELFPLLVGAHCMVVAGKAPDGSPQVIAFRDAHGIRPLSLGKTKDGYMVASETVGLDAAKAKFVREIAPGELIRISADGRVESQQLTAPRPRFDLLELIYLSSADSLFKGVPIWKIREAWGALLAERFRDVPKDTLVVAMPNSGIPYARGLARELGLEFSEEAVRKILHDRSFMQPNQAARDDVSDRKYAYKSSLIHGRRLIVADDSIVRGTTTPRTTRKLKEAGAASVSWAIGSPTLAYPNFYGIDLARQDELMAARHHNDIESMRREINCQRLIHLTLPAMLRVLSELTGEPPEHFETSCFDGIYPIDIGDRNIKRFAPHNEKTPDLGITNPWQILALIIEERRKIGAYS